MGERLYTDTPYAEPAGFWRRMLWWMSRRYERAEFWQRSVKPWKDRAEQAEGRLREAEKEAEAARKNVVALIRKRDGTGCAVAYRPDPEEAHRHVCAALTALREGRETQTP